MPLFVASLNCKKGLILFFLLLFNCSCLLAQLKVDFTMDKESGCSPLTVSFKNATTGASASAIYKWDLGNNNTSPLTNPGATYRDEKTYSVTLTVTDGAQTVSKTKQVIVFKKPVVDFSASIQKGCAPLGVSFTGKSTAGDGTISSYFWDYGDGNTQQTSSANTTHTYTFAQKNAVSLTVTNSNGCYNTAQKTDLVEVLPGINIAFAADKTFLCNTADATQFNNTSTGPADITYSWDFGDGKTSSEKSPSHVYSQKGVYSIKLTVNSASGCSQTVTQSNYINVANFNTDFSEPTLICENTTANFISTSTPTPTTSYWEIDNNLYSYFGSTATYNFNSAGTHIVKLVNKYGTCEETKTKNITVKSAPKLNGFVIDMGETCGVPVTVKFKDTTSTAVKWNWSFGFNGGIANIKEPSYNFTQEGGYTVNLSVTNADGCGSVTSKWIDLYKRNVYISILNTNNFNNATSGCIGLTNKYAASSPTDIKEYKWDFGDGETSTLAEPEHTYTKEGNYTVRLNYTTTAGCKDFATSVIIQVLPKPKVDFTASPGTTICGNSPVTFTGTSSTGNVSDWSWRVEGVMTHLVNYNTATVQFQKEGEYTITLIGINGGCRDTIVKTNYIKVLPPFPRVTVALNTCDGTRGQVTFTHNSDQVLAGTWIFDDGSTAPFEPNTTTVQHTYTKTGTYNVVLSGINGQCTVRDSIKAYVLLKQQPKLTSTKTEICGSNSLDVKINNLEKNPFPLYTWSSYNVDKFQYGDATNFGGSLSNNYYWDTTYIGNLTTLDNGKKDLRAILRTSYFNCYDTSNVMPLKIKGPIANFGITQNSPCFRFPILFTDSSKTTNNVAIKTWEWNFGDGTTKTFNNGNNVNYTYTSPGYNYISLKVTDADGCSSSTNYYNNSVSVSGPKADFYHSPATVTPNTTINFYNNTNTYNSYSTQYLWQFPDGTTSANYYPDSYSFPNIGTDTVKLIARDNSSGCADTAVKVINVKNVSAAFTYTTSYVNSNSCPPVVVKFTNTSLNSTRVSWDFGDGSQADNQNFPSHTYYNPGVYNVTLYVTGINGLVDSTMDSITIKGPYAILGADVLSGCSSQTVTLNAMVKNASSFTWDFGDGSLIPTNDTFAVHTYTSPGIYTPALILKDQSGCPGTSELREKVVIDSLSVKIKRLATPVCDSALVFFNSETVSLAQDQLQQNLTYKWDFGTGNPTDTSNAANPNFRYQQPGKYAVKLKVTSPYGCEKEATDTVLVIQRAKGTITAPAEICEGAKAEFMGSADMNTNLGWSWQFGNGNSSNKQTPDQQVYNSAGSYKVVLIVDNAGCKDTTTSELVVRPIPNINPGPKNTTVCLGNSVQITAGGGDKFYWRADEGLSSYSIAQPTATPKKTTTYKVEVTNLFGCTNVDSVTIGVAAPFKVALPDEGFICSGQTLQLVASGAFSYKWINNITAINNLQIANPVVNPTLPVTYTVVGYDAFNCFTDTQSIKINVAPLPTVSAGPNLQLMTGSEAQLHATGSSDVVKYNWSPTDYLTCINCPDPIVRPRSNISYVVTATTQHGCSSSDTLSIKLLCDQGKVYIPTAFTPNGDYKNDRFYIKGAGVKIVRFIKIFNRFGEPVFEKTNFNIDDPSSAWDGRYKGVESATGAYVYFTEMICDNGETFSFKGTVMVVR